MSLSYCCRFCALTKSDKEMYDLKNDPTKWKEILEKMSLLNTKKLDFSNDSTFPKTICFSCEVYLNEACEFVNKIDKAQGVLASLIYGWEGFTATNYLDGDSVANSPDSKVDVKNEDIEITIKIEPKDESDILESKNGLVNGVLDDSWKCYPWVCRFCQVVCGDAAGLGYHCMQEHAQCMGLKCADCNVKITGIKMFISHVRKHRSNLEDICYYCNATLTKSDICTHMLEHISSSQTQCNFCGHIFNDQESLDLHIKLYRPGRIRRKRGAPITVDDLTCQFCKKEFKSMNVRRDHEKRHSINRKRDFSCDRCGKAFFNKGTLINHIKAHENNKPHVCKICNKAFLYLNMLKRHVESHYGIKKYFCEECGKSFCRPYQLKSHRIIHTAKMPYMCQFCPKSFRFAQVLKVHERSHTGAKPYTCDHCDMPFNNWSNYNKHMIRRHGISKAKTKKTATGVFPIDPVTGNVMYATEDTEEWTAQILAGKSQRIKKSVGPNDDKS